MEQEQLSYNKLALVTGAYGRAVDLQTVRGAVEVGVGGASSVSAGWGLILGVRNGSASSTASCSTNSNYRRIE